MVEKDLKDLMVFYQVYHQGSGRELARASYLTEAKEELQQIQSLSCGEKDINLYKSFKDKGIFGLRWLKRLLIEDGLSIVLGTP